MEKFKVVKIWLLVLTLAFAFSNTKVAFAATDIDTVVRELNAGTSDTKHGSKYLSAIQKLESELKGYSNYTLVDGKTVKIGGVSNKISPTDYNKLCASGESLLASVKAESAQVSDKSVQDVKNKVTDMVTNQFNIEADTGKATDALRGFQEPISMIIGILAWIVIAGMGLFTAVDVAYIVIPPFRGWYTDSAQSGSKITGTTDHKTGEAKLRWVSDEAVYAVKVAVVGEGKSPISIYLFKRIGAYIMVAIVVFILLTGNVQIFVNLALSLVGGIIEQLQSLAS